MQTVTSIDLSWNHIGDKGAQHLAEVLRINTVRKKLTHWLVFYYCVLFDTDNYVTEALQEWNWRQRSSTSGWSFGNQHGQKETNSFSCLLLLFGIWYRRLRHSTFATIKLENKALNIWLRLCESTRSERNKLIDLSSIIVCYLIQTLTSLNLEINQIGDMGAQHLAHALQINTVTRKEPYWLVFYCCLLIHTDTYHPQPRE